MPRGPVGVLSRSRCPCAGGWAVQHGAGGTPTFSWEGSGPVLGQEEGLCEVGTYWGTAGEGQRGECYVGTACGGLLQGGEPLGAACSAPGKKRRGAECSPRCAPRRGSGQSCFAAWKRNAVGFGYGRAEGRLWAWGGTEQEQFFVRRGIGYLVQLLGIKPKIKCQEELIT